MGANGSEFEGLRRYLSEKRKDEFVNNFSRKLFAYALGRNLSLSDQTTITKMQARLVADGYRLNGLVESIVTSPQFLNQRGRDDP